MADITKHDVNNVAYYIKHDLRELPPGKSYGNLDIDTTLTEKNYSLVERGKTAEEVNQYRKQIESECFKYNRKNIVRGVELVIQLPDDCPPEQQEKFFKACYDYVCSTLPMGERCVYVAQVHLDEHKYITNENGEKVDISRPHIHIAYVPATKDTKHDGYDFKLCADDLTRRARLKAFHPGLQKHLDDCKIPATVYRKKEGDGKSIKLSVKQLKELTDKTGIRLEKSLTVEQLADILNENQNFRILDKNLDEKIHALEAEKAQQDQELSAQKNRTERADQNLEKANHIIAEKNNELASLRQENEALREAVNEYKQQLSQTQERLDALEKEKTFNRDSTWGTRDPWGERPTWGNKDQERTW